MIVLPEYSDVPCVTNTREEPLQCHQKYIGPLLSACRAAARRYLQMGVETVLSNEYLRIAHVAAEFKEPAAESLNASSPPPAAAPAPAAPATRRRPR